MRQFRRSQFSSAALGLALALSASAAAEMPLTTTDDFCIHVQQLMAETAMVPENEIHPDYASFKKSKTFVRPLQSHQFLFPEPADSISPVRVSCKVKTADHLNAEYGPGTAGSGGPGCRDVNRATARRVHAQLLEEVPDQVRVTPAMLVFDPDDTRLSGSAWTAEYQPVYLGDGGRIHIEAKALRVDWDNFWLSWAPDSLRGAYYCHLIAPEHLRRIMLGEVAVAPR